MSGDGSGTCPAMAARDSRDRSGPVLTFGPAAWAAFVTPTPSRL
ncbi:DUF397 domain-containing protein [Micromonospora inyonensis]|nr:DUF397 domain-containing protein [Micromonospora inyonensis]